MNIIFVTPSYLPTIGGVERHLSHLVEKLLSDGHYVHIFTYGEPRNSRSNKNSRYTITYIERKTNIVSRLFNNVKIQFSCYSIIRKSDLIHYHDFSSFESFGYPLYLLFRLMRKKLYITFHGWEGVFPPAKKTIFRRKIVEKLADRNICIGEFIPKWYGTNADLISYGGVDPITTNTTPKRIYNNYILFVGRLESDTDILEAVRAWGAIAHLFYDYEFIVCGGGSKLDKLNELVLEEGIPRVTFKGFVTDVNKYLINARLVFTSGYLGILEAFAAKKPVISTYDHALKEDYLRLFPNQEELFWVVPDDVNLISEAVVEALVDETKVHKAYEYACENTWEKVKDDYYKLWNDKQ